MCISIYIYRACRATRHAVRSCISYHTDQSACMHTRYDLNNFLARRHCNRHPLKWCIPPRPCLPNTQTHQTCGETCSPYISVITDFLLYTRIYTQSNSLSLSCPTPHARRDDTYSKLSKPLKMLSGTLVSWFSPNSSVLWAWQTSVDEYSLSLYPCPLCLSE